jgi:sugar porter (SP) family MFS transporter
MATEKVSDMKVATVAPKVAGRDPQEYAGRFNFYTFVVIITGAMTGLLLGYDNGVMGGVVSMEDFQYKFFYNSVYQHNFVEKPEETNPYCKYNSQILQLVISCLYLAAAVAAIASEFGARRYGRKVVMIFAGAGFIIGAIFMAAANGMALMIVGRVVMGLGVGAGTMIGPVYLAEMAPAKLRGSLNVIFQLFVTIGILIASLINYGSQFIHPWGWRLPLAIAAVPGIFILLAGIILPDSPNSLLERGKTEEALRVLQRIRGVEGVDVEYADILEAARQSNLIKYPYANICKRKYRPQLITVLVFMIFQQFDGINAIIFYAPILFDSLASGALGGLLNTVIINIVNVLSTVIAIVLVDRLGRRVLLLTASAWMFVTQVIVAIVLAVEFGKYGSGLPSDVSIGVLVVICVYICGHAYGWGPIGWLYPTEIQPLETRAAGAGINTAQNMLFTFVIGQSFTTMLCSMEYGVFLFFAGCLVFMGVFTYFLFPETTGIPVETVHSVFKEHPIWVKLYPEIREVHAVDLPPPSNSPIPSSQKTVV